MLLKQMKYFIAVVDYNSFTEAAEQMFISQSAISQQIQALERELGVELIKRENRRFHLTAAGEYFYRHSRGLLEEVENLRQETIRLGQDHELKLRVGYLRCYSGLELRQAIVEFSELYPEVSIDIVNGTHEELYTELRSGGVDLVLSDQRRAFSEEYVNYQILQCDCYVEVSGRNQAGAKERVEISELRQLPCILISSKEQRNTEQEYYQNTLGFGGNFLFAENLEEGRLMVIGNRGFLPVEGVGTLPTPNAGITRIPLYKGEKPIKRNYCGFWRVENANYYIEEFASLLRKLIHETK